MAAMNKTLSFTLQDAATTGDGTEIWARVHANGGIREHTFYVVGSEDVATGAVTIETAPFIGYTGVWAPIGDAVTVSDDGVDLVRYNGALRAVRARISTEITGGTVSVFYEGN